MSETIFCQHLKKQAAPMAHQIYTGELGTRILTQISQEAWQLWQKKQTMLINENKLNMLNLEDRAQLEKAMVDFLFEGKEPVIAGYVPKDPPTHTES